MSLIAAVVTSVLRLTKLHRSETIRELRCKRIVFIRLVENSLVLVPALITDKFTDNPAFQEFFSNLKMNST